MRVLITGGAGFIGSHLADAYLERGDEVFILDDLSTGSIDNIRHLRAIPGFTIRSKACITRRRSPSWSTSATWSFTWRRRWGPADRREPGPDDRDERAWHRGRAGPGQQEEEESPGRVDLRGLWAERPRSVSRGRQPGAGPDVQGRWSYACSKAIDEFLALAYWRERKLPTVIVRLFNTVGPRQTGQYGMVVPTFVKQALTGRPITIYGDGSQSRCFTDVGDVVGALMKLMDHPGPSARSSTSARARR